MKQTTNIFILGFGLLLTACNSGELPDADNTTVAFRPDFQTGETQTRSIVTGTGTSTEGGAIHQVNVFVTKEDGSAIYPGTTNGVVTFTKSGADAWEGQVNLHSETARIYAYYPTGITPTLVSSGGSDNDTHYIAITPLADQTFDGTNTWDCSAIDYLYGTSASNPNASTAITASNQTGDKLNPSIYLQHALAQVAFTMQTAADRPLTDFDFIKKITIKFTSGDQFATAANMLLKDGTLTATTSVKQLTFIPTGENDNGGNETASTAIKCGDAKKPVLVGYGLVAPLNSPPADKSITISVLLGKKGSENKENERELSAILDSPVQWAKGKRYVYPITLTNKAITVGTTEITPWTEIKGGNDMKPEGI